MKAKKNKVIDKVRRVVQDEGSGKWNIVETTTTKLLVDVPKDESFLLGNQAYVTLKVSEKKTPIAEPLHTIVAELMNHRKSYLARQRDAASHDSLVWLSDRVDRLSDQVAELKLGFFGRLKRRIRERFNEK